MQVVVFDLDTALCRASTMDGMAMARAIKDVANCEINSSDIKSLYDLNSIWLRHVKSDISIIELDQLKQRFLFHLKRQILINSNGFQENRRLIEHINHLQTLPNIIVAVVCSVSVSVLKVKAKAIGLELGAMPLATSSGSDSEADILSILQSRLSRSFGCDLNAGLLIAGVQWRNAAELFEMQFVLPDEFSRSPVDWSDLSLENN